MSWTYLIQPFLALQLCACVQGTEANDSEKCLSLVEGQGFQLLILPKPCPWPTF